jgi:aspartokinase/homoserine dehydrogenase 1
VQAPAGDSSFNRGAHWQVHKFGGTCMATADRIRAAAELVIKESGEGKVVVVSAMGSHPSSPVKVTDLLLNMIRRAANSDAAFLLDLAALQDKHVETAKALLGQSGELTSFVSRLLDDISNLKAMLQAMSIGGLCWRNEDLTDACICMFGKQHTIW